MKIGCKVVNSHFDIIWIIPHVEFLLILLQVWSPFRISNDNGTNAAIDNPRPTYTHEDYVDLLVRNGPVMTHDYSNESLDEDPRMMAFFDSLVQREREVASSDDDDGVINSSSEVLLNDELSDLDGSSTRSDFETSPFGVVPYPTTPPRLDGEICSTVVVASSSSGSGSSSDVCSEDSLSSITNHSSCGRSSSRGASDNGGGDAVQHSGASYSSPTFRNALAKAEVNSEAKNALSRFKRLRDSVMDDSDSESGADSIPKKRCCSLRKKFSSAVSNSEGEDSARNIVCEDRNGDERTDNETIALPLSSRNGRNPLLSRDCCSGCFDTDTCDSKTCNGITPKDNSCLSDNINSQTADSSRALSTDCDFLSDKKQIQNTVASPAVELSGSNEIGSTPGEQFRQIKNRERIFRGKYRASERKYSDTESETE